MNKPASPNSFRTGPDEQGMFGIFGGRFVAETLMPLILDLPSVELWLDPRATARELDALLAPPPAKLIRAYEVSTAVNSPSVDRPECIESMTRGEA